MSEPTTQPRQPRYTVDPMYSAVAVLLVGGDAGAEPLDGHIYEISLDGMRFELDEPLAGGTRISVAMMLPGCTSAFSAEGCVTRVFDAIDDPGPRRMEMTFDAFVSGEAERLAAYLDQRWLRPAAIQVDEEESEPTCEVMIETTESTAKGSRKRKSASAA
jgi:hypothetical protein